MAPRIASISPGASEHVRRAGNDIINALAEIRAAAAAVRVERRRSDPSSCFSAEWNPGTTYCSIGFPRDNDYSYLAHRRSSAGFHVALTVYDLIPFVAPQYYWATDLDVFGYELTEMIGAADQLFVISEHTCRDLQTFAQARGAPLPDISRVQLGSDLIDENPEFPHALSNALWGAESPFILSVGTIEIRKNHQLLLDVWEMLLREAGSHRVPKLVLAGQRGWVNAETLSRIECTPEFEGVVHLVLGPTDPELAWLYRNCEFTVYPSRYEGWGLPVTESLDFTKHCISSNTSSLPEAGEGLTDMVDPFDRSAWKELILRYSSNRELLSQREAAIAQKHRHVGSHDTAQAILELIDW